MGVPATSGQLRTNVNDLQVGDYIACRYTANSNTFGVFSELGTCTAIEIPVTSSAIPDGLFYFICVGEDHLGRKKLIADRNIQHSISWDTLNSAGVASDSGLDRLFTANLIPGMTSNTEPEGIASASSIYSTNFDAWEAFNRITTGTGAGWSTQNGVVSAWLEYEFVNPQVIKKYVLTNYQRGTGETTSSPKDWTFEGSSDGISWDILDTQVGHTDWANGSHVTKEFIIDNSKLYKKYRINISANNGDTIFALAEMEMMGGLDDLHYDSYLFTIRLLTGGISSTDKNNEWDKIIVESDLNETITPGDDNVWHWSGVQSWTSTTRSGVVSSNRSVRGNISVSGHGYTGSDSIDTIRAFRPVLLVESLNQSPQITLINNSLNELIITINDLDLDQFCYKIERIDSGENLIETLIPLTSFIDGTANGGKVQIE